MVIVWRGLGIAVPILLAISAAVMSLFFDDTRLGNAPYVGWSLVAASVPVLLVGLASLAGDDDDGEREQSKGGWLQHTLFLIPVVAWFPMMLGGGIYLVTRDGDASEPASDTAAETASATPKPSTAAPTAAEGNRAAKGPAKLESFMVSDTPRTAEQWMTEIGRAAGCPSEALSAWCEVANGWPGGSSGQIGAGESVFVGLTVDLHGGKDLAAAFRTPAISTLAFRSEGESVVGDVGTVGSNPTVVATVDALVKSFAAKGPKVQVDGGLAGFLRTLPGTASEAMSKKGAGWTLAGSVPTEIRRVGAYWVTFETHSDRIGRVGIYTDLPPA